MTMDPMTAGLGGVLLGIALKALWDAAMKK